MSKSYISTAALKDDEIQNERANYLGASEIGVALGFNPFRTPHNLWRQKVRDPKYVKFAGNEFTKWGIRLENSIALGFAEDYRAKIRRDNKIRLHKSGILSCSLDRVIVSQEGREKKDGPGILEVKNIGQFAYDKYRQNEVAIPLHYYAQHQQQFYITGYKWGYFIMLVGGHELKVLDMKPDPDYMKKQAEYALAWWKQHVENREEPALTATDAKDPNEVELVPDAKGATDSNYKTYLKYKEVDARYKALSEERQTLQNELVEILGNKKQLVYKNGILAAWTEFNQFDSASFKAQYPDLYKAFQTNPVRRFNIKNFVYEDETAA